ncbi:MAG: FMN-binding protein [Treponema sp.]|nr:FMN-binding protein [Treponema sp.]
MKYFLISMLALIILICGCAALYSQRNPAVEVFEGTGQGYRGPIIVQVYADNGTITEIVVVDSDEDRNVGAAAIEELIELVVLYNSTDIDAVSGATETSRGFLEAVRNAILRE